MSAYHGLVTLNAVYFVQSIKLMAIQIFPLWYPLLPKIGFFSILKKKNYGLDYKDHVIKHESMFFNIHYELS